MKLQQIVQKLNAELQIAAFGPDPAFSRFIPAVYDQVNFEWKAAFEEEFSKLFNGLMIKGAPETNRVFLAVFPTDYVLEQFIAQSSAGDLLFMHHPLLMECGDPQGKWGEGFVPIKEVYIKQMKEKQLSCYTCHIPLDYHPSLGTSMAIANQLNAKVVDGILPSSVNNQDLILICRIENLNSTDLIERLKRIFDLPYVDFEGQTLEDISKIAIVAGCGDKVQWMQEAEKKGVQAYISGEIHCHIDNEYGRERYNQIKEYASETSMSLIGVSHSSSEYLVKKTLVKDWFKENLGVEAVLIPQEKWWL
ncbi:Nif3-like dinuclear metal center hexameric protein [Planococcus maritimus]|uniref:Nif3-like dinuclear metal center hexameric protein n=1 Tax=Planococcus maritimus TaxID=192421 RepID=UPI00232D313F|nr:Nif3-like dinuclear metal center hexameric protein [Planococcus maritimus]